MSPQLQGRVMYKLSLSNLLSHIFLLLYRNHLMLIVLLLAHLIWMSLKLFLTRATLFPS